MTTPPSERASTPSRESEKVSDPIASRPTEQRRSTVVSTPKLTLYPTPRPTLELVNSPGKRTETFTTSLGQTVDATVSGFEDGSLRFDQLVLAINEGERLLGVPYPSPIVTMRRVTEVSGGFCGNNQTNYAPRYAGDSYAIKPESTDGQGWTG